MRFTAFIYKRRINFLLLVPQIPNDKSELNLLLLSDQQDLGKFRRK
jgi:hypothetical protein